MRMSGSTRGESVSNSLDGANFAASYNNGQRGAYTSSGLERSGSFRDSLENRILVTGPSASRSTVSSSEIPPLSHYLSLESFTMGEQKCSRSVELRKVLGVTVEDHSFGSATSKTLPPIALEELKRLRASIFESSTRARDRSKALQESILKLDKYRNLRRRQRTDQSNEKLGNLNPLKLGNQTHQSPTELASPRLEERAKNVIPNKRMRSSMVDVRAEGRGNVPLRLGTILEKDKSVLFDKDRSMLRVCNGAPIPLDDKICGLPPGGEGWERNKRKRSAGLSRASEGDREIKQSVQQRPKSKPRLRSSDGNGFRPGLSSGTILSNKIDSYTELNGGNFRGMPKNDQDSGSVPNERREHSVGLDNERTTSKGCNKLNVREDAIVGNQSTLVKGKASRAPRIGLGIVANATSNFLRPLSGNDGWEQTHCISKIQPSNGGNKRKGAVYNESSSPSVTQWVGQRASKISRTRRVNVVSPVSTTDETQFLHEGFVAPDIGARLTATDASGLLVSRGITNNAHQQKAKHDNVLSPSVLSESEESGAVENKFKDKGNDNFELDDGDQVSLKRATFNLPIKKKTLPKEDVGDGVRRLGRSGRGSTHSKACLHVPKAKLDNIDSAKLFKNVKHGSERSESRIGRPPLKKMSDRKAGTRTQITNGVSLELTGESEDDRELLFAVAEAARNTSYNACPNNFWIKMESFFTFVTPEDISFVKHQINFAKELDASLSNSVEAGSDVMAERLSDMASSLRFSFAREQKSSVGTTNTTFETRHLSDGTQYVKTSAGRFEAKRWTEMTIPHRLLTAIITEDDIQNIENELGESNLHWTSDYVHYGTNRVNDHPEYLSNMDYQLELEYNYRNNSTGHSDLMASNNFGHLNIQNFLSSDEPIVEKNAVSNSYNGSCSDNQRNDPNHLDRSFECKFGDLSLDDRMLMELRSVGLHLDAVPDLTESEGEIDSVISELKLRLYQQVRKKKTQLDKLEKEVQDVKAVEERKLEQVALNKLVDMAYKRLMVGRGSHKSGTIKVSKQLALAFARRTIARCHNFEAGQSCFSEPALRDVMFSVPLNNLVAKHYASGAINYLEPRSGQLAFRVSGVTSIMERHGVGTKISRGSSEPYQSFSQIGDRKKKDMLLDDVVTGAAPRTMPVHAVPSGMRWKRAEREKDQNKDALGRSSTAKAGRPSASSGRGERKAKIKPKQKIAQLSTSGSGIGRVTETANFMSPVSQESFDTVNTSITKIDQDVELQSAGNMVHDSTKEIDDAIFTNLPLHGIDSSDELDVAEGLGGQGQDIAAWLSGYEDALQDHDLVGLEIPMDDLSELKLNF